MYVDLLTVVLVGLGFYWGYSKGIIYAVISWIGLFIAGIFSLRLSGVFADKLGTMIDLNPEVKLLVGSVALFLLILLSVRLLIFILDKILKSFSLDNLNKIAGGLMYTMIVMFLWSELLWYAGKWSTLLNKQQETSHVYGVIHPLAPTVLNYTASMLPVAGTAVSEIDSMAVAAKNQLLSE